MESDRTCRDGRSPGAWLRGSVVLPEPRMGEASARIYALFLRSVIYLRNSPDASQKSI